MKLDGIFVRAKHKHTHRLKSISGSDQMLLSKLSMNKRHWVNLLNFGVCVCVCETLIVCTWAGGGQHGQGSLVMVPPVEALQELLLALQ